VPIAALTGLKPGRIVPADLALRPQMLVEGMPLFEVEPGEKAGKAAISLTRRIDP
jgi:flagellar motor switch protein FliM